MIRNTTIVKNLYNDSEIRRMCSHLVADSDWSHVHAVIARIGEVCEALQIIHNGLDISDTIIESSDYKDFFGETPRKEWEGYMIVHRPGDKESSKIGFRVTAHSAGTKDDPFKHYDITATFWND